ncbi:hypothetical protein [Pseudocolwellia agarivorans]|uniref:hypothetical protein n=1 Tax=Pseudocolwellia agarivorans TaxID=1911682 RepID=UPI003F882C9B
MYDNFEYLCAACNEQFPINKAVDGYKQGYPTGFLCPLCHTNLKEKPADPNCKVIVTKEEKIYNTVVWGISIIWLVIINLLLDSEEIYFWVAITLYVVFLVATWWHKTVLFGSDELEPMQTTVIQK